MHKKILSITVAFLLMMTLSTEALADNIDDQINQQNSIVNDSNKLFNSSKNSVTTIQGNIELLDEQIGELNAEIKDSDNAIAKTQTDIKNAEKDISAAEEKLNSEQELFNQRMRAIYVSGSNSTTAYLSIILQSKDFGDFLSRVETVKKLADLDAKIVDELKTQREVVNQRKAVLVDENNKLVAIKADKEKKKAELTARKDDQKNLIAKANADEAKYNSQIQAALKKLASLNDQKKQQDAGNSPSGGYAGNATQAAIVQYAERFLKCPYVWGGNGPNVFDCSGFTKYVYANFGITLNRVAADQAKQGTPVSKDQLQPGDLLFFGPSMAGIHHVAIYVGMGIYIHAPKTGDVIKYSALDARTDFYCARRFVNK